jgi:hypothetical protein
MSDPHHPAASAARTRPGTVQIATYLLYLTAGIFALTSIVSLATVGTVRDVVRDVYAGTSVEGMEGLVTASTIVGAVVQLLFAAGFVVLALLNSRGHNAARITTWVVGVLGLCCVGVSLGSGALNTMNTGSTGDAPSGAELADRLSAEVGWLQPFTTATSLISLLALLAAMILLALPPSNEYFRKPQASWEPPVPGGAYPGYPPASPGYPPASPGYPPASPGYPPASPGDSPGYPPNPSGNPPDDQSGPSAR